MTSVERAQRFLQAKARTIALTVAPLAAVAVAVPSADAAALSFSPSTCSANPSGGGSFVSTPSCNVSQLATGANGVAGVKLYGTATLMADFDTYLTINITTQGSASGTGGTIPLSYDFTLSNTSSSTMDWDVYFDVAGDLADASGSASGVSTGGTITGGFTVDASNIGNAYEYVLHVEATDENANGGDTFTLNVPQNSIDVNPVATATPEPASWSLLGLALGPLAWWKRRSAKKL
jgi:PEP-CTERM motif